MHITGGIVYKDDTIYLEASSDFNLALRKYPCIIVFCFSEYDVKNALDYVVSKNIPFRVRSGRHDYEANSTLDNGMVIDISNINYTFINESNKTAKLGAGITSGKMYSDLINKSYTIPSGTCTDVGFCGLTTCGGVGNAARLLGLSSDNLLEIEIINYKGKKIIANKNFNTDLFWAVRGGLAANFGIVISLTFKITPVSNVSTYFITWKEKYFANVLDIWQRLTPYANPRLTTNVTYEKNSKGEISLSSFGQFFGDKRDLECIIKPLINAAPIESIEIKYVPYKEALNEGSRGCPSPQKFKATGSFIYNPLSKNILKTLEYKIKNAPKNSRQFYEFIGLGGNITKTAPNESAFFHRDSLYLIEIESVWNLDIYRKDNVNWTNNVKDLLDPVSFGTYRGFTDFDIINWQKQYYGDNYTRLRKVKTKYDPLNIFKFPQSIEPIRL